MSNNSVSQIGGNTTVISTGTNNYLFNDKNFNGKVDEGDLFVLTRQSDASVTTYVVGQNEGMIAWGDPHLDNFALTAEGKTAVIASLGAAFADVKDGVVDNAALLGNIDAALKTHGSHDNIMDFHVNIAVRLTDGTRVEFDVARVGKVAFTDNLDVDVRDEHGAKRTVTLTEIWAGNGGAGQSGAVDSTNNNALQAVDDPNELRVFHEYTGANVMHGAMMFGTDAGTKNYAYVIDADGKLNVSHGQVTRESRKFQDAVTLGYQTLVQAMQLGGYDESTYNEEVEKAEQLATATARQDRRLAIGKT